MPLPLHILVNYTRVNVVALPVRILNKRCRDSDYVPSKVCTSLPELVSYISWQHTK